MKHNFFFFLVDFIVAVKQRRIAWSLSFYLISFRTCGESAARFDEKNKRNNCWNYSGLSRGKFNSCRPFTIKNLERKKFDNHLGKLSTNQLAISQFNLKYMLLKKKNSTQCDRKSSSDSHKDVDLKKICEIKKSLCLA